MSVAPAPALVEVDDLSVAYHQGEGWLRVVHGVSFTIARGEALGLVGESGCGKSTVAYHLLGYGGAGSRVEGGRVLFKGADLLRLDRPALDRIRGNRVSFVPQNPTTALDPGMRVGAQVAEALHYHKMYRDEETERVADLFRLVGLPEPERVGQRYQHQLSGGQQQRVCIAMALACEPDLVVLDEPTTGLDVTTQEQIVSLLADLRARLGMSMLYVTHDLGVLAQIADRVGVMYAGRIVEIAPTAILFAAPRHPYSQGLIASVPRLEAEGTRVGIPLRGYLRRDELPAGCAFQPRCDYAEAACAIEEQRLETVASAHDVACRRWASLAPPEVRAGGETTAPSRDRAAGHPVLRLEDVSLGYGAARRWAGRFGAVAPSVVENVSLAIGAGETFALVGESGSGKSTVARAVSGLLAPSAGHLLFEGRPLEPTVAARPRELRRRIQYIFQNPDASLNPRAKIGAILARPIEMFFELDRRAVWERVAIALGDVRLDAGYARRYPDELSGGERQRVAIARALVAEPTLLICDEILSALDVSVQANVIALLSLLRREHHLSMLFISHDLAVVRDLADRVGVLFRGRMMEIGSAPKVFAPPYHPYTHTLLMAAPSLNSQRRRPRRPATAPGAARAQGCVFAARCPWKLGRVCEEEPPPWRETDGGHRIRCHIPLDELAGLAEWSGIAGAKATDKAKAAALN